MQVLDFARPWALALLPSDSPKDVKYALYVPYRSDPEAFLSALLGSSSPLKIAAKAKGYVMLTDSLSAQAFPAAKTIDTKSLARYPAGSVKLWGDVKDIAALLKDSYKPIEDAMRKYLADPSIAKPAPNLSNDPEKIIQGMVDALTALLEQIDSADAALVLNADGMTIRAGAAAAAGSDVQKLVAKMSKSGSALDWASQVDASSLYGCSWVEDYAGSVELMKKYLRPLFETIGLDKASIDALFRFEDKYVKAAGERGALSFDFDIDAAAFANAGSIDEGDTEAISEFLKTMMSFDADVIMEAKDEAAYRSLMRGFANDPDLKAFLQGYSKILGLDLAFTNDDKKDGSFSYGELGVSMKVGDPSKLGLDGALSEREKETMDRVFETVGSMLKMRWAVSGGKCYITTGDVSALKALISRKAAPKSLASTPSFAAFTKSVPKKPVFILSMSAARLGELFSEIGAASGGIDAESNRLAGIEGLSTWYSYLSLIDASSVEGGFFVPIADIRAIAAFAVQMSSQGAQSGGDV